MLNSLSLPPQDRLLQIVVKPLTIPADRTVIEAISLMNASAPLNKDNRLAQLQFQARSGCVAIVENGRPIGIFTDRDVVRLCAERQEATSVEIRQVMSAGFIVLDRSSLTDLEMAIDLLDRQHVSHLFIIDDREARIDLVTRELLQMGIVSPSIETAHNRSDCSFGHQMDRELILREIGHKIRRSLELPIVFETAVREIRSFLTIDRVGIFQFTTEESFERGKFVAESVAAGFESILGLNIYDPNFGAKLARYYQKGGINIVEDIHSAGLLDDEVEILSKFHVRANLVVPLLDGNRLWGLLCLHQCCADRIWQEHEISFVKQIAEQIGIGVQQATLYAKVQSELQIRWRSEEMLAERLRQQHALGKIAQQIRNSLSIEEILATAVGQIKELMSVDRVSIFRLSADRHIQAVSELVSAPYPHLLDRDWQAEIVGQEEFEFYLQGKTNQVDDVMHDRWSANLPEYVRAIGVKSKIVAPILLASADGTVYPQGNTNEVCLWGLLSVHACGSKRNWQDSEVELLQAIADRLAIAIHQASLFERLQSELTERERAQVQLRQSNEELARATKLKDEFLANMSHELRTPLNAVLGLAEGLAAANFGTVNERQQRALATIEKSGKHLLALINDILDLSKIEASQLKLDVTVVAITSLCKNSILFVKELAHKQQISISIAIPADLEHLKLRVDDLRFRQILINLLSNAVKFTPPGGQVTLTVEVVDRSMDECWDGKKDRQITFSVSDTGIGIAPENLSKLFQSFVQIDSSLNRQYAGTGLGLALVQRISELHGGSVSVCSQLDRGSCFTVHLPFDLVVGTIGVGEASPGENRSANSSISGDLKAPEPLPPIRAKALVLIADDNEANMETMTGYLQTRGYRLIEATTGRQAIELAATHHPDIILMDIQMPDLDGLEAISRIRQLPEISQTIIVAVTALAMPTDRQKCLDAGADAYVTKPVKLGQLVATIEKLLHGE